MVRKRLNNKGYMLVEIILASAIAFGLAYYMLDLTLKVKNRNDDLLVATLMETDKTIISNKIMESIKEKKYVGGCSSIYFPEIAQKNSDDKLTVFFDSDNYVFKVNKYAKIDGNLIGECDGDALHIKIPLRVKANTSDDQFDVDLFYYVHPNN